MKSRAHIYMANIMIEEIEREKGYISLKEDRNSNVCRYKLPDQIYRAIHSYPSFFRAGSVGPDFFPDLILGQMTIHPRKSGEWLKLMMEELKRYSPKDEEYMKALSFYLGFMVHYAGDMFTHDYVNRYARGWFPSITGILDHLSSGNLERIKQGQEEIRIIIRHLAVETYLDNCLEQRAMINHVNEQLNLDIPLGFLRSCFATKAAVESQKKITGESEEGVLSLQILNQYVLYYESLQDESLKNSTNRIQINMEERAQYIKDWLRFWNDFAEKSTRMSIVDAYNESEDQLIRFLQAYFLRDEKKRGIMESILDTLDFLGEINILDPLLEPIKELMKGSMKKMVFPYIRPIAAEISGKDEKSIKNFDQAIDAIIDTFVDVTHLLRCERLFGDKNLPEKLLKEWGNIGWVRDSLLQDFKELDQAISMAKLCIMGTDNLNQIVRKYNNSSLHFFQRQRIIWSVRELFVIVQTSEVLNAESNADIYLGIYIEENNETTLYCELALDHPGIHERRKGAKDQYVLRLPGTLEIAKIKKFHLRQKGRDMWICSNISIYDNQRLISLAYDRNIKLYDKNYYYFKPFEYLEEEYEKQNQINSVVALGITIKTSGKRYSGTDNDVFFGVRTINGYFEKLLDKNMYNDFEAGDLDTYHMKLPMPIKPENILEFQIHKKGNDDWRVEYVTVTDSRTERCLGNRFFNHSKIGKKWEIIPMNYSEKEYEDMLLQDLNVQILRVTITTSRDRWSGTDDDVYIVVKYKKDNVTWENTRYLDTSWHNDFENGDIDTFFITLKHSIKVSDIISFRVYKKGSDDWTVEEISIHHYPTGRVLVTHREKKKMVTKNDEIIIDSGEWKYAGL